MYNKNETVGFSNKKFGRIFNKRARARNKIYAHRKSEIESLFLGSSQKGNYYCSKSHALLKYKHK